MSICVDTRNNHLSDSPHVLTEFCCWDAHHFVDPRLQNSLHILRLLNHITLVTWEDHDHLVTTVQQTNHKPELETAQSDMASLQFSKVPT